MHCRQLSSPPSYNTSGSSSNSISEDSDANGTHAAWNGRTSGLRWAGDDESDDESNPGNWAGESAVSSDSDDDVLEVCLSCSRCNSSRDSRSSRSPNDAWPSFARALSKTSTSKTIAPIVPARLKTTGVGNGWGEWVGTRDAGLPEENTHSSAFDTDDGFEEDADTGQEDKVFTHRSAYFSADGVHDYLGGPDLGVEFGPTLELWGRRGSTSTGTEILDFETEVALAQLHALAGHPVLIAQRPAAWACPCPPVPRPRARQPAACSPPRRVGTTHRSRPPPPPSQGRGCSATRTSSSSSLSDCERSRSSHTSPLRSLSREYGGVHISADYGSGGYAGGASVSPEKARAGECGEQREYGDGEYRSTTNSAERDATASPEGGDSTSNSGSSGATATRPRVEANGVRTGAGCVDGKEDETEYETRGRGCSGVRVACTFHRQRHVEFGLDGIGDTPGSQTTTPQPPKSAQVNTDLPPRTRPVNGALPIEEEVPQYEYGSVPEETDEARPRPRTRRVRVPRRRKRMAAHDEAGAVDGQVNTGQQARGGRETAGVACARDVPDERGGSHAASAGPRTHARLRLSVGVIACGSSSVTYRHWVWSAAVRAAMRVPRLRFACRCYGAVDAIASPEGVFGDVRAQWGIAL
ncbi:hypothetical protein B0H14DRAFT_3888460 [Mycena olivaceomarginata]|nr:hypothetical protein B0H14DRAFT_3888460 [Mycena olivaceomarginata]